MTSQIVREGEGHQYPGQLKEIRITCDHAGCDKTVTDETIREGGGLKAMGWTVASVEGKLRHYCSEHPRSN